MYCKNTSVLLFYCHAHARPRKTTSIQGLLNHHATLRTPRWQSCQR